MNAHPKLLGVVTLLLVAPTVTFCGSAASVEKPNAAYVQSFEKWKAEQTADLKESWLSLVGLFWLKPGTNSFGGDPSNAIVFPKGPAHAGQFVLNGKEVTLKLQPQSHATIAGKSVIVAKLEPDSSKNVTRVEMGTLRFHIIVRGEHVGVRVRDTDSESARSFKGMMFFPLDMNYSRNGRMASLRWQEDGRSSQRAGRSHLESIAGNCCVQAEWSGITTDRNWRR